MEGIHIAMEIMEDVKKWSNLNYYRVTMCVITSLCPELSSAECEKYAGSHLGKQHGWDSSYEKASLKLHEAAEIGP